MDLNFHIYAHWNSMHTPYCKLCNTNTGNIGRSNHAKRHRTPGWSLNLSAIGGRPALVIGAHMSPSLFANMPAQ
jgi:hypothetical protein